MRKFKSVAVRRYGVASRGTGNDHFHTASGRRPRGGRGLAPGRAGKPRHAAGFPPVRLCGHRQDHARKTPRPGCRRRRRVRRLHRQGRARHAPQGLPRRLDDPQHDLSRARERRGDAELRIMGRGASLQGEAHRDRRMLDGRRRARPRPALLRRARAGAGRSRAAAADPGRRLLHRRRARRHAHRGAPPGDRRSDRASLDGGARRTPSRALPLRRHRGGAQGRARPGARAPRGAPTTRACASGANSPKPFRPRATSSCACATTAARACSTAGCGR